MNADIKSFFNHQFFIKNVLKEVVLSVNDKITFIYGFN